MIGFGFSAGAASREWRRWQSGIAEHHAAFWRLWYVLIACTFSQIGLALSNFTKKRRKEVSDQVGRLSLVWWLLGWLGVIFATPAGAVFLLAGAGTGFVAGCVRLMPEQMQFKGRSESTSARPMRIAQNTPRTSRERTPRSTKRSAPVTGGDGEDGGGEPDLGDCHNYISYYLSLLTPYLNRIHRLSLSLKTWRDCCRLAYHRLATEGGKS